MKKTGRLLALSATAICALGTMTSCNKTGFKVGLLCLHGQTSTYDNNFIEAFEDVCQNEFGLEEGSGYEIRTDVAEDYNQIYTAAKEWAEDGYSMIFADSFGHQSGFEAVAREYPDTEFCHATGTTAVISRLPNYHNAFADIYKGRYLAGVAAGQKMIEDIEANKYPKEEANIGYVGAWPYAEVISGYTSFYLGACSVFDEVYNPEGKIEDFTTYRPKMFVKYTYSWYDYGAEKEAAFSLINTNKCKLISQHADSMGAPQACAAEGVPNVCYNISTEDKTPNTYLYGSKINWRPYFKHIIEQAKNKFDGGTANIDYDYSGGMWPSEEGQEVNSVMTLPFGKIASDKVKEKVAKARTDIDGGAKHVFDVSTFTITKDDTHNKFAKVLFANDVPDPKYEDQYDKPGKGHIKAYRANVIDDPNYEADTDVVKEDKTKQGVFFVNESGYVSSNDSSNGNSLDCLRSAPYFELIIDGIETLN